MRKLAFFLLIWLIEAPTLIVTMILLVMGMSYIGEGQNFFLAHSGELSVSDFVIAGALCAIPTSYLGVKAIKNSFFSSHQHG